MSSTKSNRKTPQNQSYSHPLIKNLEQITQQTHSRIIPTYIPITGNNKDRISCNIIRSTTLTPSNHSSFTLFVNPFSQGINELPLVSKLVECPVCRCAVNPYSKISNYSRIQCNLCGCQSEIPIIDSQISQQLNGYRIRTQQCINSDRSDRKNPKIRRVCLVIQISEYLYESKLHNAISNCLSALRGEEFEVGIIFFDNSSISILNQSSLSLSKLVITSYHEFINEWSSLPIAEDDFFRPVSEFNQSVMQIIESVMYEGFYIKQTAIAEILTFISSCFSDRYQIKAFISTLNNSLSVQPDKNVLASIFKINQNKQQQKRKKSDQLQSINLQNFPLIPENMQFFILNKNVSFQDSIKTLGYRIAQIYQCGDKNQIEQKLYYDLYQSLQRKQHSKIQFTIKSSVQLSLAEPEYPSYNLYGKISLLEGRNEGRYRTYKLQMRNASANNILPIKFNVNGSPLSQKLLIQISYEYSFEDQRQRVILNYSPKKILSDCEMGIESLDDQAYFNDHMRQALAGWNGEHFKDLKQKLQNQCEKFVRLLKSNYSYDSIHFPKTMKHYFLYVFSFIDKIKKGVLNSYHIYKWLNSTLKILSKQMYPRTFKIEDGILKNIKSSENITQKYEKLFIQNGQQLFLVLGDCDVSEIKDLFGYYDQISSISIGRYELPDLPSNSLERQAIDLIRSHNPESFLRLKIVDKQSQMYQQYIKPLLYNKNAHIQFLRKAWRNS